MAIKPASASRRILRPDGTYVAVGSVSMGDWIGPLTFLAAVRLAGMFRSQTMTSMLAATNSDDLRTIGELAASGTVKPVIDRTYPLEETAAAMGYVEAGHARAKVVVTP